MVTLLLSKNLAFSTSRSNPKCEPQFIATAEKKAWNVRYKLAFRKSCLLRNLKHQLSPNPRTMIGKIALFFRNPLLQRRCSGLHMLIVLERTAACFKARRASGVP